MSSAMVPARSRAAHPDAPPDSPRSPGAAIVSGAEPDVLREILRPEVNLAVWNRELPDSLASALATLAAAAPFAATAEGAPDEAIPGLLARLPGSPPLALGADIRDLATLFAGITGTGGPTRLRLEGIAGPACHRWHADAVGLRLLCTYHGPGTECLATAGGAGAARALTRAAPPHPPLRLPTGAVAILKGEGHPGNAGFGMIHRSPPAGPGPRARLLLCLDEPGRIPLE